MWSKDVNYLKEFKSKAKTMLETVKRRNQMLVVVLEENCGERALNL